MKGKQNGKYHNEFIEIEKIGNGAFGNVYKTQHKLDTHLYAIKKVKINSKFLLNVKI